MADADNSALLDVRSLSVVASDRRGNTTTIVEDVSFQVAPGQVVALIGESGSGKTTISLACLGYQRPGCRIASGHITLDGVDLLGLESSERRRLRGQAVAYVAQSAAASFNAALKVGNQVIEGAVINGGMNRQQAQAKAIDLYRQLDLPEPERIGRRYPHQLSGGQLQRLMAAMAMMGDPKLLILDEPTTALDVTTQIEVLKAFKHLIRRNETAAIYVSHDLAVVAQIADYVLVLNQGRVVEYGATDQIIQAPKHAYTQALIAAAHIMPSRFSPAPALSAGEQAPAPVLQVDGVSAAYSRSSEWAIKDVSLQAWPGRTVGVIGESGSGKTTLGRVISGLMGAQRGEVMLNGERLPARVEDRTREQQRQIQFAFQMADVALNPRHRVSRLIGRPLEFYFELSRDEVSQRVRELLELVELPTTYINRFPRQLSGGEKQRVNLARALAAQPAVIICDEVTSALDTVIAEAIIELLQDVQRRLGVGYVFISHDISTVARVADSIAVMRAGEVLEYADTQTVLTPPFHPYTRQLLDSVPELRTDWLDEAISQQQI